MKAVVLCSGGIDSATLAYFMREQAEAVHLLSVNYGQRHVKELASANEIAHRLKADHTEVDLRTLGSTVLLGSSQTDPRVPVPHGHYAEDSMKKTVVPNRNMILLSIATGLAISTGAEVVAYAAHAGDHTIYPDCRREFADAMNRAMKLCDWSPVSLERPFVQKTKAEVVALGATLDVPFEITWSCYEGLANHCGKCGTCVERIEAFELAGVEDPTHYEGRRVRDFTKD